MRYISSLLLSACLSYIEGLQSSPHVLQIDPQSEHPLKQARPHQQITATLSNYTAPFICTHTAVHTVASEHGREGSRESKVPDPYVSHMLHKLCGPAQMHIAQFLLGAQLHTGAPSASAVTLHPCIHCCQLSSWDCCAVRESHKSRMLPFHYHQFDCLTGYVEHAAAAAAAAAL